MCFDFTWGPQLLCLNQLIFAIQSQRGATGGISLITGTGARAPTGQFDQVLDVVFLAGSACAIMLLSDLSGKEPK